MIKACEKASRALAEWMPMYHPTAEQAEIDRKKAYESGVPHGYVPPGDKYKDLPTITLTVLSELVRQYWQGHQSCVCVWWSGVGGGEGGFFGVLWC